MSSINIILTLHRSQMICLYKEIFKKDLSINFISGQILLFNITSDKYTLFSFDSTGNKSEIMGKEENTENNYNIYIIIINNLSSKFSLLDSNRELPEKEEKTLQNTTTSLSEILTNNSIIEINYLFSSITNSSIDALALIIKNLKLPKNIIVLPRTYLNNSCLLDYTTIISNTCISYPQSNCNSINDININWNYSKDKKVSLYYNKLNIIQILLNIIKEEQEQKQKQEQEQEQEQEQKQKQKQEQETINVILVTHNARMRCFLEDYFKSQIDIFRKDNDIETEIRFNNSSILLLTIENTNPNPNPNITLELVYDGGEILNPKGDAYFVQNKEQCRCIKNKVMNYIQFNSYKSDVLSKEIKTNKNYKIYIIRHGEAEHNNPSGLKSKNIIIKGIAKVRKELHTYLDPSLTEQGKKQAEELATYFNKIPNFKIDYAFASYLKRTRETLDLMLTKLTNTYSINSVIILPCSHELYYNKKGNCDANQPKRPVALENRNYCLDLKKKCKDNMKYCCKLENTKIQINWSHYITFKKSEQCRKNNMIELLIKIIEDPHMNATGGVNYYKKYLKYKYKYLQIKNSQIS